ncbi:hypothetical protein P4119_17985 [Pseudomonas aeruginosa]|nr:hypothetical protein [Pseudomonas aeruginosa]
MQIDLAKTRREALRWLILLTLNNARPVGGYEGPVLSVAQEPVPRRHTAGDPSRAGLLARP